MPLRLEPYATQVERWPKTGHHILAQFDDQSVVVYQAYRPSIGRWAAANQRFGGDFSFGRMSWVKPNFLWMMYRCGWATKPDQETVLAVRIRRSGFDALVRDAVPSSFRAERYATEDDWKRAVASSSVRVQWDPDHDPAGRPVERRAIQLGLRGDVLRRYATEWIVSIEDVTPLVAEQRAHAAGSQWPKLVIPREDVYPT